MSEARAPLRHVLVLGALPVRTMVVTLLALSFPPSDEWLHLLVRDSDTGLWNATVARVTRRRRASGIGSASTATTGSDRTSARTPYRR